MRARVQCRPDGGTLVAGIKYNAVKGVSASGDARAWADTLHLCGVYTVHGGIYIILLCVRVIIINTIYYMYICFIYAANCSEL